MRSACVLLYLEIVVWFRHATAAELGRSNITTVISLVAFFVYFVLAEGIHIYNQRPSSSPPRGRRDYDPSASLCAMEGS